MSLMTDLGNETTTEGAIQDLVNSGVSDAEARGTVWPDSTVEEETLLANSTYEEWISEPS